MDNAITLQDIIQYYEAGCKKADDVAIGMEVEKHGICQKTRKPITYFGKNGLQKIQEKMIEELGWKVCKREGKFLMSLERCGSYLTLETPECESELSGRTHPSLHDLARELAIHQHEESVISKIFGVLWLGIGIQPFASNHQIRRLKSPRYTLLYDYLKNRGGLWEDELKKTASIQANIDYTSETDARRKFQILLRLSPFLAAIYAHAPLNNGKLTGFISYRLHVLTHNDPDRFGIRPVFFKDDFGFKDWVDFCLKIPMICIHRKKKWIPVKKMTFGEYLNHGFDGFKPTIQDWLIHTGCIYSFARLKKYIELRTCDSVPPFLIPSMQAVVKAFVYHPDGERMLRELTKTWTFADFNGSYEAIAKHGMQVEVRGKKLLDSCKELIEFASINLKAFKVYNERKEDESVYLRSIKDFVFVKEQSPGRHVAELWEENWKRNPEKLIEWCRYD